MTVEKRQRSWVRDLPSAVPNVPPIEGEDKLDVASIATEFLASLSAAIEKRDWEAFGQLFADKCFWKDSLTITFDKRTLFGRADIVAAWKALAPTRNPSGITGDMAGTGIDLEPKFQRPAPVLATLDVPFSFSAEAPQSKCAGVAKLIPEAGTWKIWVLTTAITSLSEHPFGPMPRQTPSLISDDQRGKSKAQGLPQVDGVLDAVVIGGSVSGLGNAIMLDAIGANVAVFDLEQMAGGNWTTTRYDGLRLHHPNRMVQLPLYPVPTDEGFPEYLTGPEVTRYYCGAVEKLKLPYFAGCKVVSNTFDKDSNLWTVQVQDVNTDKKTTLQAKNIVISNNFIVSAENLKFPALTNRDSFRGPVQHATEYRTVEPYRGLDVVIVGSGNSAHDIAGGLVTSGAARSVTILQRSPTVLLDYDVLAPLQTARYAVGVPIPTADFLQDSMPIAIGRDMSRGALAAKIAQQTERNAQLEAAGYVLDKTPCMATRMYEERGRSVYADHPRVFDLVLEGRIRIAQGEARGFTADGLVVYDKKKDSETVLPAGGVVFATGYETIDIPKRYAETGFVDAESASMLENVNLVGVDVEGELPGYITFSGHPHLYFSGIAFFQARWIGKYTAIQVMADVKGIFPARYPRSTK